MSCLGGMQWRSWLRHCATNWKVTDFIPRGFDFFVDIIVPATLGLTQPLTGVSTRNIFWGVGGKD